MARRPITRDELNALVEESLRPVPPSTHANAVRLFSVEQFAASAPVKRKRSKRSHASSVDRFVAETRELITKAKTLDPELVWRDANHRHLVALYAIFHDFVYEVLPQELAVEWLAACSSARKLLDDEFGGVVLDAVEYLRETFLREKKEEQRKPGRTWRVTWRAAFTGRQLLTDYRVAKSRVRRASRPG